MLSRNARWATISVLALTPLLVGNEDPPPKEFIPRSIFPSKGDYVLVQNGRGWAAVNLATKGGALTFSAGGSSSSMIDEKDLFSNDPNSLHIPSGTRAKVAESYSRINGVDFRFYKIILLDGRYRGRIGFIYQGNLTIDSVQAPKPGEFEAEKPTEARSRTAKADDLFKLAKKLDDAKKVPGALTIYRQIAKEYPETDAAKKATDRIKILTKPNR